MRHSLLEQGDNDMATLSASYILRTLLCPLFAASLILTSSTVRAQEPTEEEYKTLQEIQAENDAARKTDLIIRFLKEKPKSSYRDYIVTEFKRTIVELRKEKRWSQVIALGEKFMGVVPNDSFTVAEMAAAYSQTGNIKGFATFGEKAYASDPSPQLALAIAKAYQSLGNDAKYMQWGEKVLASDPDNVEILGDMTRRALAAQNMTQAVKYARMCLKALPKATKSPDMNEEVWKNTTDNIYATAYGALGAHAFQSKNYSEAIKNLDSAVKHYKRNEVAYYYLGMSYWQQNKLDAAMLNFAKAYLIKGSISASAKKYLEQLYAASHRNSLVGINRVIERAQKDLR